MNVDWNWIKQRPHFIAEGLCDYFQVTVLYKYHYNRKGYQKRNNTFVHGKKVFPVYAIPRIDRYAHLKWINILLLKWVILFFCFKDKPDFLFLTHPRQVIYIPFFFRGKVIYDCMDAHSYFVENEKQNNKLLKEEKLLCDKANYIFTSSEYLKDYINQKYQITKKVFIIRNAYNSKMDVKSKVKMTKLEVGRNIVYFGTISDWFDYNLICESTKEIKINYYLFGPISTKNSFPKNDNIFFEGTLEHNELAERSKEADALIMPFVVDEKIKAVDPVKLYEYINLDKCIISVWYPELVIFEPFVYFYKTYEEYKNLIFYLDKIDFPKKYSEEQKIAFLKENSWEKRCERIKHILGE